MTVWRSCWIKPDPGTIRGSGAIGARSVVVVQPTAIVFQLPTILIQLALAIVKLSAAIVQLTLPIVVLPLAIAALLTAALVASIIIAAVVIAIVVIGAAIAGTVGVANRLLNIADGVVNKIGVRKLAAQRQGAEDQSGQIAFHRASLFGGLALR